MAAEENPTIEEIRRAYRELDGELQEQLRAKTEEANNARSALLSTDNIAVREAYDKSIRAKIGKMLADAKHVLGRDYILLSYTEDPNDWGSTAPITSGGGFAVESKGRYCINKYRTTRQSKPCGCIRAKVGCSIHGRLVKISALSNLCYYGI